jgi:putative (di)nucleoside polyphosphate hydrolase
VSSRDAPLYRPGVGIVLLNPQGRAWIGRRSDVAGWQMPQGGIDPGESPEQACLRELVEEVGTDRATILAECGEWLSYDLPREFAARAWGGRYRGQRQKWFALRFLGSDRDIDPARSQRPEFVAWRWERFEELPRLVVGFKRALYERVVAEFQHLVTPG